MNKISEFFRLNLIAHSINHYYKLNIYMLFLLFMCIISSIIIRSNFISINKEMLFAYLQYNYVKIMITILTIFTIVYSLKLIFDVIYKGIQAFRIIPEFIQLYKSNVLNIKSIISLYYIQNTLFMLLSLWILYVILTKLNLFMDGIYLFIITIGILSSTLFIYYYPKNNFNFDFDDKGYPIYVYFLIIFFIIFYMFIFPLTIIKIIESDKFLTFKNEFINDLMKKTYCYMDTSASSSGGESSNNVRKVTDNNAQNSVNANFSNLNDRTDVEVSGNNSNNNVTITSQRYTINNVNITGLEVNRNRDLNLSLPNINNENTILPPYSTNTIRNQLNIPLPTTQRSTNDIVHLPREGLNVNISLPNQINGITIASIENLLDEIFDIIDNEERMIEEEHKSVYSNKSDIYDVDFHGELTDNIESKPEDISKFSDDSLSNNNPCESTFTPQGEAGNKKPLFTFKKLLLKSLHVLNKSVPSLSTAPSLPTPEITSVSKVYEGMSTIAFTSHNVFRISNDLYQSLFTSSSKLLSNLCIINSLDTDHIRLKYLIKIIFLVDINNNIQLNLITLVNSKAENNKIIISLIDNYILNKKTEKYNLIFTNELYNQLINISNIYGLNVDLLKEYYILNDFDYLAGKNKYKIDIKLLSNLKFFRKEMVNFIVLNQNKIDNENVSILYKLFNLFDNDYSKFINCFDKNSIDNYHKRFESNKPFILPNKVKNNRDINYYNYLFNICPVLKEGT